ncbi:MAG: hypothetical protein LBE34_03740 [Flavobacteriaceae bacterium]|jgi:hypothetical protein|nr:hypothetical protein [Flavobacteriaceae bacterium]
MRKVLVVMFVSVVALTACSKSDENNTESNTLRGKVIGKWFIDKERKSNSYQYNNNGTAEYINYYQGKKEVYSGIWKLTQEDVLLEYYPEEGESIPQNWEKEPDIAHKVIAVDAETMQLQSIDRPKDINTYYRSK